MPEHESQSHLCRQVPCNGGPGLHCCCYAAVDAEALVDLGAYYGFLPSFRWSLGVLAVQCLRQLEAQLSRLHRSCYAGQRRPTSEGEPRRIQEQGVLKALDPESESETDWFATLRDGANWFDGSGEATCLRGSELSRQSCLIQPGYLRKIKV